MHRAQRVDNSQKKEMLAVDGCGHGTHLADSMLAFLVITMAMQAV